MFKFIIFICLKEFRNQIGLILINRDKERAFYKIRHNTGLYNFMRN